MTRLGPFAFALLMGCADQIPEHIELVPAGAAVEIVYEAPSPNGYTMVGEVRGVGVGADVDAAKEVAKNDLRNKAGAAGGTLVTIEENLGEPMLLVGKTKVTLLGRAYKPLD